MGTAFQTTRVESVVKRGWRRRLLVLAVDHLAPVLAFVFGALSVLILLGTQILAWQWVVGIATLGVALAAYGMKREIADQYQVAQLMDQQLSLHDSLSTAWFIRTGAAVENETAAVYQLNHAERLAETADPREAFPFRRARVWTVTAALFAVAIGLFSARYLVTRELNLRRSFLPFDVSQVFETLIKGSPKADADRPDNGGDQSRILPPGALGQDSDKVQDPRSESNQKGNQQSAAAGVNGKANQSPDRDSQESKTAEGQGGDQKSNGAGDPSKANPNQQSSNLANQQDSKQQDGTGPQHSNSLMDRMRDALSSVMAKIKPTGAQQNSQSSTQKNADGQKSPDQSGNKDQAGDGQKDSGKEQSAQEQSSGEQQGQGAAKAQASQGKDSAQPSDKKGSDAQSGVGHSDGDKQLKEAEQARAMGKLAEIIGKRSASLTGDMQIEPSGKQQLQTGYTHQQGQHADLGGEINRDEIPVEDQEYVREYMELVRKKPAKTK